MKIDLSNNIYDLSASCRNCPLAYGLNVYFSAACMHDDNEGQKVES